MALYLSGFLVLSGLPDTSYYAGIYDSGFNKISSDINNTYSALTTTYSIYLSGLVNNNTDIYQLLVFKNNWTCSRSYITGINMTGYYNLV